MVSRLGSCATRQTGPSNPKLYGGNCVRRNQNTQADCLGSLRKENAASALPVVYLRVVEYANTSMHITWHGQYTLKIQSGDTTLVIDPYAPTTGLPPFRAKADIVALSNAADPDMSHVSAIQGEPGLIATPGEYSLKGFTLHALGWRNGSAGERSLQRWQIEDMMLLHVGALNREMTDEELRELEKVDIDILFVPVGGGSALTAKQAVQLTMRIEPRMVIPIHFQLPKLKEKLDGVEPFAKEMGVEPKQSEKKLSIKAKNLPQDELATVILMP
jgi:L-ascorbate metabolism protein UlaG (beta-lactamase superfamily)